MRVALQHVKHSEININMFVTFILLYILASAWGQDGVAPAAWNLYSPDILQAPENLTEDDAPSDYIVGGYYARDGQIPYQVSLQTFADRYHFCGGSILNDLWILTAAHCLIDLEKTQIEILAGSTISNSKQVRRKVLKRFNVGRYRNTITDDIALLKLESRLPKNNYRIQTVALPTQDTPVGTRGIVSGWGYNKTGQNPQTHLKYLVTRTISNQQCKRDIRNAPIGNDNICTLTKAGEGFCQGDSGGPLVDYHSFNTGRSFQIGVVSANVPCARGKPDIYARVYPFVRAIRNIMARN